MSEHKGAAAGMLRPDELRALDNWRFEQRMPSRAAAVCELFKRGLTAEGFTSAGDGSKSQEFGPIGRNRGGSSST